MKNICVFCGSSSGVGDSYLAVANELGVLLAQRGYNLIYGGASIGTMGAIADSVLESGGKVTGIIPKSIADLEVSHRGLTKLEIVEDMHQRKARMMELADAFIALPGGLGTLEELFEVLTWQQLGFHSKPCGLLNTNDFYQKLDQFLNHANQQGFIKDAHRENLCISASPKQLISKLANWKANKLAKL